MTRYTSVTDADLSEMLGAIGVGSIEELFADIPASLRLGRPLSLGEGLSEQEVFEELSALAARSTSAEDEVSFLGAGMYDHYAPALIDSIILRSEFLTPYTPYQPEISQGGLQAMFEYQTAISELTGLPVSNASVYEGPSAVAAAGYVAKNSNNRKRFVISRGVHPHSRECVRTLAHAWEMEVVEAPLDNGVTVLETLGDDVSAVIVQQPNFLGAVEDLTALADAAKQVGALTIAACDPLPLALLKTPARVRRRHRGRRGPDARQPPRLRRPVVRVLRRHRGADAPDARPDRGRDEGPRRQARVRADAADARAAHPAREGDLEHLHGAGAERARRRDLPELARSARDRRAGRADAPADRVRARPPQRDRRRDANPRPPRGSRVRDQPRRAREARHRPLPGAGDQPGLRARTRLPRVRQRAARRDHRATHDAPTSIVWPTSLDAAIAAERTAVAPKTRA